jgi:uncharacterized membrane protein YdfJ with MMPL/SSD domain
MPLVVGLVAIAVLLALALAPLAELATDRARARTAADAAALAGAAEGEDAAREVAKANGARMVLWHAEGDEVWVGVELGRAKAAAKAHRD